LTLSACGDPVERHIAKLIEGGEGAEEAKMELNMARKTAIAPLIAAFQNRDYPSRARVDLAEALYRLYLREADKRIFQALIGGLEDPDATVRTGGVRALGDLNKKEGVGPLVARLEQEADDEVRREILLALELISLEWREVKTHKMTEEEKARFTTILVQMTQEELPDSLRGKTLEWLEVLAEERTLEAQKRVLKADLNGAETLLLSASDLIPDSKNIHQKLGRFYYDHGRPDKGLEILSAFGMMVRARKLKHRPHIDGLLEEPAWQEVSLLTDFYQCIWKKRAYPIEGKAEVYVGYWDNSLYLGIKGYESSTDNLVTQTTQRDGDVYRDDCVEIFLDPNHDYRTYYALQLNSIGTLTDGYSTDQVDEYSREWNGSYHIATQVEDTFWTVEIKIPAEQFREGRIQSDEVWGFNVARVRIANASEYGQWVPTYGAAHRPDRFGFLIFG